MRAEPSAQFISNYDDCLLPGFHCSGFVVAQLPPPNRCRTPRVWRVAIASRQEGSGFALPAPLVNDVGWGPRRWCNRHGSVRTARANPRL